MQSFGDGHAVWRARVVLQTANAHPGDHERVVEHLRRLLSQRPGEAEPYDLGGELGQGERGEPTLAASFWVRADDVGAAAVTAVDTMMSSGRATCGERCSLYELVLVPEDAVVRDVDAGRTVSFTAVREIELGA